MNPTSAGDKLLVMVVAIVIFVALVGLILWAIDRPKIPNWVVVLGFLGPVTLALLGGLFYPAVGTVIRSFQKIQNVIGPDGKRILVNGKVTTEKVFGLDNYGRIFTEDGFQRVLLNTVAWVILVPLLATGFGLIYAVLVDRTRFEKAAKALVFLPMAISMVGASIIWKFVYDYRQAGTTQTGLANQLLTWLGLEPVQFLQPTRGTRCSSSS